MKMYSLNCKDMGIKCNYVATAESREEVMDMAKEHFEKAHPKEAQEAAEKMSPEELEQKMMEKMVEKNGDDNEEPMEEGNS